jgi:hypothetical protein
MLQPRQFSLAYLFLEVFWIGAALALARQAYLLRLRSGVLGSLINPDSTVQYAAVVALTIVCGGTAIGGLFRRMELGAVLSIAAVTCLFIAWVIIGLVVQISH